LDGNGLPTAFLAIGFLAIDGLTMFGDLVALFATGFFAAFFATAFFATFFAGFFGVGLLLFFADFLNNFLIATIPPEGAKVMAWLN
jgi:RsiW-degrading membrane proteinase PrsW (M82 family)